MSAPETSEIAAPVIVGQCVNCGHDDHHGERCDGLADDEFCACSWPDPSKVGRPRSAGPRTSTAVRLPDALHDRLNTAAIERDVSLNFLMVKAVEQFLDHLIPVEEMRWTRD